MCGGYFFSHAMATSTQVHGEDEVKQALTEEIHQKKHKIDKEYKARERKSLRCLLSFCDLCGESPLQSIAKTKRA
jgi:hypothetical protein